MPILRLPGSPALSNFRLDKLLQELRLEVPTIRSVATRFEHIVHLDTEPSAEDQKILIALLHYGPAYEDLGAATQALLVVPRIGTISPWASKATDIALNCGIAGLTRVERGVSYSFEGLADIDADLAAILAPYIHDRMTETLLLHDADLQPIFATHEPAKLRHMPLAEQGRAALDIANKDLGLALSVSEIDYLVNVFEKARRDPTDAELMMFAQANSEHCRHKIFNATWILDGIEQEDSLFDMIRSTHASAPDGVLSAYTDNCAVIEGGAGDRLFVDPVNNTYDFRHEDIHILMKVETHNHPTAISPFPGAATGSGGEIRDEGATGRGASPKAGLSGYSVSHLRLPGFAQPWEATIGKPDRIASAMDIMLEGPIGGAAFNNEFGRPNIQGYFRTFEQPDANDANLAAGYHKPIMIAGGLGNIRAGDVHKPEVPVGALIVVLGGPAMLIGLGGGAASSMGSGSSSESLDYASVQRGNPEMERRAQQVIDACWAQGMEAGGHNPIVIIHDVGAGGLSNAVPELVDHSRRGAVVELQDIPNAEPGMSPLEIWCNEAQERYMIAVMPEDMDTLAAICERERCIYAVIGSMDDSGILEVRDSRTGDNPVEMDMHALLGKPPQTIIDVATSSRTIPGLQLQDADLAEACHRVLRFPTVADKSFLIHIGDRTVGGLVARDQLVGPWQVPVSDVGVTARGFNSSQGEAMAMGERTPVALLNPAASGRLAVGEVVTNLAAANIAALNDVRLSANWMAASGFPGEDQALYETVAAVATTCRDVGIAIPVGKDSLSMQTRWQDAGQDKTVFAPLSLIVSGFAPVIDIRKSLTPQLARDNSSSLYLIDLGAGANRLGASCLSQVFELPGGVPADLVSAEKLKAFFEFLQAANSANLVQAYHDRSDGGLFTTISEMAFAGRTGVDIELDVEGGLNVLAALFSEELGGVVQIAHSDQAAFAELAASHGLTELLYCVGRLNDVAQIRVLNRGVEKFSASRASLHQTWSEVSYRMQALRDNPTTAAEQYAAILDDSDPGLNPVLSFDPSEDVAAVFAGQANRPRVAILREQGVNSQNEMAAAFRRAGFDPVDVHMSDILTQQRSLDEFKGLVACGGFSFGDVLGAGGGWAKSILFHPEVRDQFQSFFARKDTFTLGVCNGCQMLAELREIIPGTEHWPRFVRNLSEQFEARLSLVEVMESPSVLLDGMAGSILPIVTSHGEGRAEFSADGEIQQAIMAGCVPVRYVDSFGQTAVKYPSNPNGSPEGIAGMCNTDGRVTIFMPHPERVHRTVQHSWHPDNWGEDGPWMRMFRNARVWVG